MRNLVTGLLSLAALGMLAHSPAMAAPGNNPLQASLEMDQKWFIDEGEVSLEFTLHNDSNDSVHFLDWQTPLSGVDNNLFLVLRDGEPVEFIGRIVDYGTPQLRHFIQMDADDSRSAVIPNLGEFYDMSEPGYYEVRFAVTTVQGLRGSSSDVERMRSGLLGRLESNSVAFWWDGSDRPEFGQDTESTIGGFTACRNSKKQILTQALDNAAMIADMGVDHLSDNSGGSDLYEYWFGDYTSSRFGTVEDNFDAIADALNNETVTFNCACKSPAYAYVYPTQPYEIYLCNAFWRAPALGRDSQAGTLVHEMSHFNVVAGTDDIVYGESGAHSLAEDSPNQAVRNADNHEYFAEDQ